MLLRSSDIRPAPRSVEVPRLKRAPTLHDCDATSLEDEVTSATRRFTALSAPPALRSSGVASEYWPSKYQFKTFWQFVVQPCVVDDEGWWAGTCPVHAGVEAQFCWNLGIYKCTATDDPCHAAGKSRTLGSLRMAIKPVRPDPSLTELTDEEEQAVAAALEHVEWLARPRGRARS